MRFNIEGLRNVLNNSDKAQKLIAEEVDAAIEKRALLMINDTRTDAPRLTGKLKNSINLITQETKPFRRVYGTNVVYARRQEYEHATKKAFFRNNVTKYKSLLADDIAQAVKKATKG